VSIERTNDPSKQRTLTIQVPSVAIDSPVNKQNMTDRPVPISLGKPSLRRRLEDYYSLIAPDQISNPQEWLTKYSVIYEKFGGSYEGSLPNWPTNMERQSVCYWQKVH
jgi:hypothetical protein